MARFEASLSGAAMHVVGRNSRPCDACLAITEAGLSVETLRGTNVAMRDTTLQVECRDAFVFHVDKSWTC